MPIIPLLHPPGKGTLRIPAIIPPSGVPPHAEHLPQRIVPSLRGWLRETPYWSIHPGPARRSFSQTIAIPSGKVRRFGGSTVRQRVGICLRFDTSAAGGNLLGEALPLTVNWS
jgi:hypothetical protein